MPRFYLDIHDGEYHHHDEDGQEFADAQAARAEAMRALPDVARLVMPDGDRRDFIIDVKDGTGMLIFTATLSLVARWVQ